MKKVIDITRHNPIEIEELLFVELASSVISYTIIAILGFIIVYGLISLLKIKWQQKIIFPYWK